MILETECLFLRDWVPDDWYGWQRFEFPRIVAVIQPDNQASIRVAEKPGMTLETDFLHHGVEVLRYAKARPH